MENLVQVTGSNLTYVYVVLGISLVALAIAYALRAQVLAANEGTEKMKEIAAAVQEGAAAYLNRQFKTLSYFVGIVFFLLFALPGEFEIRLGRSIFFLLGALFSAAVGYNGMWLAVRANVRVAEAARQKSAANAVKIAFRTGGVVGMTTVGLGLLGASLVVAIYKENAPAVLEGFGFGAAMLAMFMRVGGGIFTKAADVGADLVGKVEQGIPEDDPRNPATIADNVGDNVVFRAGFAKSRDMARQLVRHGHFIVNGKKVNIPSYRVSAMDIIDVLPKSLDLTPFIVASAELGEKAVPAWMEVVGSQMRIIIHSVPARAVIDTQIQEQLIVELYSK